MNRVTKITSHHILFVVPIGFIYVQLPSQSAPTTLWPASTWQDVTNEYAGLFFRALGGSSGSFESIQSDNGPRITEIKTFLEEEMYQQLHAYVYPNGEWSDYVTTGRRFWLWMDINKDQSRVNGPEFINLRVRQSQTEVRPRNTAVRIWRKTS